MILDTAHAASLQARHESPWIDLGTFITDAHSRAFAAAAGALAALGADMARADLEEQLVERLHEINTTLPENDDTVSDEWAEARRLAGLMIGQYTRDPAAAATYLAGRWAPSQPVNRVRS